ncbi:SDR family oxidoreductase [Vibrio sp.]|nr:SDR family oxidoreductase [Vibrio sp.]
MIVFVVGGSGGIGAAMIQYILNNYPLAEVHATYHSSAVNTLKKGITWHQLNVQNESEVKTLAAQFDKLDWLINAVGLLSTPQHGPEKRLEAWDSAYFETIFRTNTLSSVYLAKYFKPALEQAVSPRFAVLSARVGSIEDNHLGGWYSYRMSKAALNMFLKTVSIEWLKQMPACCVLALHPGTTNTELSRPFHRNIPEGKLFSPERVAQDLIQLIQNSTPDQSGRFCAYDGEGIPW